MTPTNMKELCELIHKEMGNEGLETCNVQNIQTLLANYKSNPEDWKEFALCKEGIYTRNLVDDGNGKFNLMVLCWAGGVSSPIHDHSNSHCLVKVLDGHLNETLYGWPEHDSRSDHHLQITKNSTFETDQVSYMHDKLGLHRISNPDSTPAVSLHLYSPPFSYCRTYCESTGQARKSGKCVFHSVGGKVSTLVDDIKQKHSCPMLKQQ